MVNYQCFIILLFGAREKVCIIAYDTVCMTFCTIKISPAKLALSLATPLLMLYTEKALQLMDMMTDQMFHSLVACVRVLHGYGF